MGDRKRGGTSQTISQYVETLIREISATPVEAASPLETVFFGGGTPSLLSVPQLEAILRAVGDRFKIATAAEVSMEMDPATFELEHVQGYQAAGVNRVSLGVQDFRDDVLAACGRFHRRQDIFRAVETLHQAGIENISFDLMSGLPHQTIETWQASLQEAIALSPTHISQYDLIVEPQTAFARYYTPGHSPLPSDTSTVAMYRMAQSVLTNSGYDHYEICNYAQPGCEAKHNITYWKNQPCYGFGMGATSYVGHQRIDRPRTQKTYRDWVEQFVQQGGQTDDPKISPAEQVLENFMVGLRLKEGIGMEGVYEVYGEAGLQRVGEAIASHIKSNWAAIEPVSTATNITKLKPSSRIRLSDPEGFLMSNVVIVDAFNALNPLEAL